MSYFLDRAKAFLQSELTREQQAPADSLIRPGCEISEISELREASGTLAGDKLHMEPGSLVPSEVLDAVKANKSELLALLRGYHMKYPEPTASSKELKEIQKRVHDEGFVILWSVSLQDLIAFYRDEEARSSIPPGFVPYGEAELKELFGDDKPSLSLDALRLIHEAKRYGGCVINRSKSVDGHC